MIRPGHRVEAPIQIDERLRNPTRWLPDKQRKALIDQLERKARREKAPLAGVMFDVDCFRMEPSKVDVPEFIRSAADSSSQLVAAIKTGTA